MTNPLTPDDLPLNLEQDNLLQAGRTPTCQPASEPLSSDVADSLKEAQCGDQSREIYQADFQKWVT